MTARQPGDTEARVTLKSLAKELGLSRTAISVVLNNTPQASTIAPATRQRILKAAAARNYKPNFLARALHRGRSYLIGVVSPDLSEGYTAGILGGIERYLLQTEYSFFTASHYWSPTRASQNVALFAERGVEGIIFINTPYANDIALPTVHIGHTEDLVPGSSVVVDNELGVFQGLEHLTQLGHRKIAFIRGHEGSVDSDARWNAVRKAARHLGITIQRKLVVQLERIDMLALSPLEEGARCAERLLPMRGDFTALMSFNDMSAIGAINRFRAAGWAVPDEVSVLGFDDVMEARIVYPPLTTIRQPLDEMGEMAAKEIIELINGKAASSTLGFKPSLIVRNSTQPPVASPPKPRAQKRLRD